MEEAAAPLAKTIGPLREIARRYPGRLAHLDDDTQTHVMAAMGKAAQAVADLFNDKAIRTDVGKVCQLASATVGMASVVVAVERLRQRDEHLLIELDARDPNSPHADYIRYLDGVRLEDL